MTAHKSRRHEVATFIGWGSCPCFVLNLNWWTTSVYLDLFIIIIISNSCSFNSYFCPAVVVGMGIRLGFGFSAGLINYLISVPKSWIMSLQHDNVGSRIVANPVMSLSNFNGNGSYLLFYLVLIN
ncbi:hypothetical protein [Spiroplasma mirum]|nr:hypothetical protein [Spiroplasma mirum]